MNGWRNNVRVIPRPALFDWADDEPEPPADVEVWESQGFVQADRLEAAGYYA